MIKLIGALCIVFAGTMLGFYRALQLSERPRQIRQSILCLQRLETEIVYGITPLPEALKIIAGTAAGPLRTLFGLASRELEENGGGSVQEAWEQALKAAWSHTSMKQAEKDVFLQLGMTLGISDRDDQTKHLRLAVRQLQAEEAAAADDQKRYGGMWRSLGLLAGVLIVILMY